MNLSVISEKRKKPFYLTLGILLTGVTGIIDLLTGYEISFSVFYVIPVTFVTWSVGRGFGILTSFACAAVWFGADIVGGHPYSHPFIPAWKSANVVDDFPFPDTTCNWTGCQAL